MSEQTPESVDLNVDEEKMEAWRRGEVRLRGRARRPAHAQRHGRGGDQHSRARLTRTPHRHAPSDEEGLGHAGSVG